MKKLTFFVGILVIVLAGGLLVQIFVSTYDPYNQAIKLEDIKGEGVCKSNYLIKNKGTEDQVILKGIIFSKQEYLGSYVSPETVCHKVLNKQIWGDYLVPTLSPTKVPVKEDGQAEE